MSVKTIYAVLREKKKSLSALWPGATASPAAMKASEAYVEQAIQSVVQAARENDDLANCTPEAILGAVCESLKLGFIPNGADRRAHIMPFRTKNGPRCQFVLGYQGEVELVLRTGRISQIMPVLVREGDYFRYQDFPRVLQHTRMDMAEFASAEVQDYVDRRIAKLNEQGVSPRLLRAAYCVIEYKDGRVDFSEPLSRDEVLKRRDNSRGSGSEHSPWNKWEDEMWKKTALKAATRYLPFSVDDMNRSGLAMAQAMDNRVIAGVSAGADGSFEVGYDEEWPESSAVPDQPVVEQKRKSGLDALAEAGTATSAK